MQELFDRLRGEGEAGLRRLRDERAVESVTLDFKRKENPTHGIFSAADKKTLGELLSGFANSAGGLAVWGVDARKSLGDEVDCVQDLLPIKEIERFHSEAHRLVGQLIMPRHPGIQVAYIPTDANPTEGYLLVLVERSERRPHRSEARDHKHYFKRSGESFFAMEHYDIEDAFRCIVAPVLEFRLRWVPGMVSLQQYHWKRDWYFELSLANVGETVAKYPYLEVGGLSQVQMSTYGIDGNRNVGLPRGPIVDGVHIFIGGTDNVIHPGQTLPVTRLVVKSVMNPEGALALFDQPFTGRPLIFFELRGGCEGFRRMEKNFRFEGDELIDGYREVFGL